MFVCNEMQKLRTYLDDHDMEWFDTSSCMGDNDKEWICGTRFFIQGKWVSVINGNGTSGGFHKDPEKNVGLLEVWGKHFGKSPVGYKTADDVIKVIEKAG